MSNIPTSAPLSRSTTTEEEYSPISITAIIGVCCGLISLMIFPVQALWILILFGGFGLILSLVARRHINESNGAVAGRTVTTAGIVISLISVLGYFSHKATEYGILHLESSQFVESWLEKLQEGRLGEAFLDTQGYRNRKVGFDPNDITQLRVAVDTGMGSPYDSFRARPFITRLARYGEDVTWERLSLPSTGYDKRAFIARYLYQVSSPEMTEKVMIGLKADLGSGDKDTPRRMWRVEMDQVAQQGAPALENYGQDLQRAYNQKTISETGAANAWVRALTTGRKWDALDTAYSDENRMAMAAGGLSTLLSSPTFTVPAVPMVTAFAHMPGGEAGNNWYEFHRLFTPLINGRITRAPTWLLLSDEKDGGVWTFKLRTITIGVALMYEFELTIEGDLREEPGKWRVYDYKFLSAKKKPADPMSGMMGGMPGGH